MQHVFDSMLPVATLLLGAGLANLLKLSEIRKHQRLDAADQLASLPSFLWDKEDSGAWIKMNAAVSRLAIRLNLAGVHPDLTERVRTSAIEFWNSVHPAGEDEQGQVWSVGEDPHETWTEISAVVAELLGTNSRVMGWWLGLRARRLLNEWDDAEQALIRSISN